LGNFRSTELSRKVYTRNPGQSEGMVVSNEMKPELKLTMM
jgi:hypothetical protein